MRGHMICQMFCSKTKYQSHKQRWNVSKWKQQLHTSLLTACAYSYTHTGTINTLITIITVKTIYLVLNTDCFGTSMRQRNAKKNHIFYLHALKTIFKKHEVHLVRFSHFTCGHNILAKLFYMIGCLDIQSNFTYIHFTGSFLSLFSFWLCNLAPCRAPVQIQSWVSDRACSGLSLQVWKFTNTCCFHHVF